MVHQRLEAHPRVAGQLLAHHPPCHVGLRGGGLGDQQQPPPVGHLAEPPGVAAGQGREPVAGQVFPAAGLDAFHLAPALQQILHLFGMAILEPVVDRERRDQRGPQRGRLRQVLHAQHAEAQLAVVVAHDPADAGGGVLVERAEAGVEGDQRLVEPTETAAVVGVLQLVGEVAEAVDPAQLGDRVVVAQGQGPGHRRVGQELEVRVHPDRDLGADEALQVPAHHPQGQQRGHGHDSDIGGPAHSCLRLNTLMVMVSSNAIHSRP